MPRSYIKEGEGQIPPSLLQLFTSFDRHGQQTPASSTSPRHHHHSPSSTNRDILQLSKMMSEYDKLSLIAVLCSVFGLIFFMFIWCHCYFRATAYKLWLKMTGRPEPEGTELTVYDWSGRFFVVPRMSYVADPPATGNV